MEILAAGSWLGIDIGSSRSKVCSFCLIESDGAGTVEARFENGPADDDYPGSNDRQLMLPTALRRPVYLRAEVEQAIERMLGRSRLVTRFLEPGVGPRAVAIDAPVAFAIAGKKRATEAACTQTFNTPSRERFEGYFHDAGTKDGTFRSNVYWKCVGFVVYRYFGQRLADLDSPPDLETLASWTVRDRAAAEWRLRELFPSDVYKRANGDQGVLAAAPKRVLAALVAESSRWLGVNEAGRHPSAKAMENLGTTRSFLRLDLAADTPRLCEMRRRSDVSGDLWDAFTCAFTACCEDHGATTRHGDGEAATRREGAITTVRSVPKPT